MARAETRAPVRVEELPTRPSGCASLGPGERAEAPRTYLVEEEIVSKMWILVEDLTPPIASAVTLKKHSDFSLGSPSDIQKETFVPMTYFLVTSEQVDDAMLNLVCNIGQSHIVFRICGTVYFEVAAMVLVVRRRLGQVTLLNLERKAP
jgi:hypothetical protein